MGQLRRDDQFIAIKPVEAFVADFSTKAAKHTAYNDTWAYGDVTIAGGANNDGGWAFVKMGGKSATISAEGHPGTWIKTDKALDYSVASVTLKFVGKCYNQDNEKATCCPMDTWWWLQRGMGLRA